MNATAVILAAGQGTRARTDTPKQLVKVAGKTLVQHAVDAFADHPSIRSVVVVHPPGMRAEFEHLDVDLVEGGDTRNESTRRALAVVQTPLVLVHDGVRPLVPRRVIDDVLAALRGGALAVDTVIGSTDTLVTHRDGLVTGFPDREAIHRGQTPQGFRTEALRTAYALSGGEFSDDCQVMAAAGFQVAVVAGDETNIKVTHPGDFAVADRLFQARHATPAGEPFHGRVVVVGGTSGIGAEVARLTDGVPLSRSNGFHAQFPDPAAFEDADAVVVTAGTLHTGPMLNQADRDILEMVETNLLGAIWTAQAAHKHLAQSGGHLVLTASSSYSRGRGGQAVYSATKAAVVALTQALAEEWPEIRVNCVCPERTDTPMRRAAFGVEPVGSLMAAPEAAEQIVAMLGTPLTGQVFDVRREVA